jgi:hypothetical protein
VVGDQFALVGGDAPEACGDRVVEGAQLGEVCVALRA